MIFSCYGVARLNSADSCRSAGLFLFEISKEIKKDWRNNGLPPYGQWLRYRHELCQVSDNGNPIDYWQAPFQTYDWSLGDCEDLSLYLVRTPPKINKRVKMEPAVYRSGENKLHTIVAVHGMGKLWQGNPDIEIFVASGDEYIMKGQYDIGLIDPSWISGMPHPYGPKMAGSDPKDPRYFIGANKCTDETDLRDRINVSHRFNKRF